jgi:hypothetical protein
MSNHRPGLDTDTVGARQRIKLRFHKHIHRALMYYLPTTVGTVRSYLPSLTGKPFQWSKDRRMIRDDEVRLRGQGLKK